MQKNLVALLVLFSTATSAIAGAPLVSITGPTEAGPMDPVGMEEAPAIDAPGTENQFKADNEVANTNPQSDSRDVTCGTSPEKNEYAKKCH